MASSGAENLPLINKNFNQPQFEIRNKSTSVVGKIAVTALALAIIGGLAVAAGISGMTGIVGIGSDLLVVGGVVAGAASVIYLCLRFVRDQREQNKVKEQWKNAGPEQADRFKQTMEKALPGTRHVEPFEIRTGSGKEAKSQIYYWDATKTLKGLTVKILKQPPK
jgi:hypothetical protein